jgi:lipoprotein signal peptidase
VWAGSGFNLADCGIVCGGTLLVLWLYLLETGQKTE